MIDTDLTLVLEILTEYAAYLDGHADFIDKVHDLVVAYTREKKMIV